MKQAINIEIVTNETNVSISQVIPKITSFIITGNEEGISLICSTQESRHLLSSGVPVSEVLGGGEVVHQESSLYLPIGVKPPGSFNVTHWYSSEYLKSTPDYLVQPVKDCFSLLANS